MRNALDPQAHIHAPLPLTAADRTSGDAASRPDLVSILLCETDDARQLAGCLRALLSQTLLLPPTLHCEVLVADAGGPPALRRVLAAAARSAPARLSLRPVAVNVERPLDALRRAARGRYHVLLSADARPQPQWLREGLAALDGTTAAAIGIDDHPASPQASSIFIRAEVLDAIAPGRFHPLALQRSVAAWHGAEAVRTATRARTRRVRATVPRRTRLPLQADARPTPRLRHWAAAAMLGAVISVGGSMLGHSTQRQSSAHLAPAHLQTPVPQNPQATMLQPSSSRRSLIEI